MIHQPSGGLKVASDMEINLRKKKKLKKSCMTLFLQYPGQSYEWVEKTRP